LRNKHIINPCDAPTTNGDNIPFENASSYHYRLQCYETPTILNSYRVWGTTTADDNNDNEGWVQPHHITPLMKRLKKLLSNVSSAVSNENGEIDYKNAHRNEHYVIFEEAICELQKVRLSDILDNSSSNHNKSNNRKALLAFGINLYNLMIKFAFMKVGIGCTSTGRTSFYNRVRFNIGGHLFSFQDWEHGILRGNKRAPYSLFKQIGGSNGDIRKRYILPQPVDERIHFALNCGAKSCPSIHNYTAESIDEELRVATYGFFEDDDNLNIQLDKHTIYLSKILKWYSCDFIANNSSSNGNSKDMKLLQRIIELLRHDDNGKNNNNNTTNGKKKEKNTTRREQKLQQLVEIVEKRKKIKIMYNEYDWSPDSSEYVCFDVDKL